MKLYNPPNPPAFATDKGYESDDDASVDSSADEVGNQLHTLAGSLLHVTSRLLCCQCALVQQEDWRPVLSRDLPAGCPDGKYYVSDGGQFLSIIDGKHTYFYSSPDSRSGYVWVGFSHENISKTVPAHITVLSAFHGPRPSPVVSANGHSSAAHMLCSAFIKLFIVALCWELWQQQLHSLFSN
jgi:hypothetical protein